MISCISGEAARRQEEGQDRREEAGQLLLGTAEDAVLSERLGEGAEGCEPERDGPAEAHRGPSAGLFHEHEHQEQVAAHHLLHPGHLHEPKGALWGCQAAPQDEGQGQHLELQVHASVYEALHQGQAEREASRGSGRLEGPVRRGTHAASHATQAVSHPCTYMCLLYRSLLHVDSSC